MKDIEKRTGGRQESPRRRLLTLKETANYLSMSQQTIYNKISQGGFPVRAKRIGGRWYFDKRMLDDFVDSL